MLVLSRKENQTITIGTSVVRILEITGSTVRVGIEADPDVDIWRGELIPEAGPIEELELVEA